MTALPQQQTWQQYVGDGMTTVFIYPFFLPLDVDVNVYVTPFGSLPIPAQDIKILNVDYTVQGAGNPNFLGGTITFISGAPPSSSTVTFVRNVQNSIDTEYSQARNIVGSNLDASFDRLMLCIQQNTTNFQTFGLQYAQNSFIPGSFSNQIPQLPDGYIWVGQGGGVVAVIPALDPNAATLAGQLLQETVGTNGCSIIGYNDPNNSDQPILLRDFLDALPTYIGKYNYAVDTGANNAFVISIPGIITLSAGTTVRMKSVHSTIAGASSTLALNSFGAIAIKVMTYAGLIDTIGYEITPNGIYTLVFNGTSWELQNPNLRAVFGIQSLTNSQIIAGSNTNALIEWSDSPQDPFGMWEGTPNFKWTVPQQGLYTVSAGMFFVNNSDAGSYILSLHKNGGLYRRLVEVDQQGGDDTMLSGTTTLTLDAGDYVQIFAQNGTGTNVTIGTDPQLTYFDITFLGQA